MSVPEDLSYSIDHLWVRSGNADVVRVGVTENLTAGLGEVGAVVLPTVGDELQAGDVCGEIELDLDSVELVVPLDGVVVAVNSHLASAPETVAADPYGTGWLFELEVTDDESDDLLDADAYAAQASA